jgi:hypothetical protein
VLLAPVLLSLQILFFIPGIPYVYYNYRLLRIPLAAKRKEWLALAVGMSACTFAVAGLAAAMLFLNNYGTGFSLYLGAVAAVHAMVAGTAITIYYKVGREKGDLQRLIGGLASGGIYGLFLVVLPLAIAVPNMLPDRRLSNEASATATLRLLNAAENTFATTYHSGFSEGLNCLGPPAAGGKADANHADLVDPVLAGLQSGSTNSFTKNGYTFTYAPGSRDGNGLIVGFATIARPMAYGSSGTRSFFADESGKIRATAKDRAATANDPPI